MELSLSQSRLATDQPRPLKKVDSSPSKRRKPVSPSSPRPSHFTANPHRAHRSCACPRKALQKETNMIKIYCVERFEQKSVVGAELPGVVQSSSWSPRHPCSAEGLGSQAVFSGRLPARCFRGAPERGKKEGVYTAGRGEGGGVRSEEGRQGGEGGVGAVRLG